MTTTLPSPRPERHLDFDQGDGPSRARVLAVEDPVEALRSGLCPYCGDGPFTVVAIHASKKHGIDRHEIRELVGVSEKTSICDPTYSEVCAERGQQIAADAWEEGGYQRRRFAEIRRPIELRTAEMARMYESGLTMREIAEQTGYAYNTVRNWLKRLGFVEDGHAEGSPAWVKKREKKGPQPDRWLSHCGKGHEMTPENTYTSPSGKRACRECARANDRKRPSGSVRQRLAREAKQCAG